MVQESNIDGEQRATPIILLQSSYYVATQRLANGTRIQIRTILPADEPGLEHFHGTLSDDSVHRHYFSALSSEGPTNRARDIVLIAEAMDDRGMTEAIVGAGRLLKSPCRRKAELAAIVSDSFQRQGIGRALTRTLLRMAQSENVELVIACISTENMPMRQLLEAEGFSFSPDEDPARQKGELPLRPEEIARRGPCRSACLGCTASRRPKE